MPREIAAKLGPQLVEKLEGSLPAISLVSMSGNSANCVAAAEVMKVKDGKAIAFID